MNPQQRWWEMYLSWCLFKINGFNGIACDGEGPDFCIGLDGRKLWIEAIAVRSGEGANEVQRAPEGQAMTVPIDKIILRFTSAFEEKVRKIKSYKNKGIIGQDDYVIVAINMGEIRDSDLVDFDPPLILQALMGYGSAAFSVPVSLDGTEIDYEAEVIYPT